MSVTKDILFGKDEAYAGARQVLKDKIGDLLAGHTFPISLRRRSRGEEDQYFDPFWPIAVRQASERLGVGSITVNSREMFQTAVERDEVKKLAEELWPLEAKRRRPYDTP